MTQDMWIILHGGPDQITFLVYLYRMLLHLLAFAAIALFTLFGIRALEMMASESVAESGAENREQ